MCLAVKWYVWLRTMKADCCVGARYERPAGMNKLPTAKWSQWWRLPKRRWCVNAYRLFASTYMFAV